MPLRTLAALAAAAALLSCSTRARDEPFAMISMDEVERLLGRPGVVVVDANGQDVYEKNHLPGARHLGKSGVGAVLPEDKEARLVFYCSSPRWTASHDAAREAARLGYRNLFVMPDGIRGWVAAGKRVEAGAPR